MFAYCENRPTVSSDPTGEWLHVAVGAAIGGLSSYITSRAFGDSREEALKSALCGAASGAVSALLPGAGAAVDIVFNVAETVVNDVRSGESYGTVVADAFISASFGTISGSSNGYLATKQATKEIREAVGSVSKTLKGNHPKVKNAAKKVIKQTTKKSCKSFASMLGLSAVSGFGSRILRGLLR